MKIANQFWNAVLLGCLGYQYYMQYRVRQQNRQFLSKVIWGKITHDFFSNFRKEDRGTVDNRFLEEFWKIKYFMLFLA